MLTLPFALTVSTAAGFSHHIGAISSRTFQGRHQVHVRGVPKNVDNEKTVTDLLEMARQLRAEANELEDQLLSDSGESFDEFFDVADVDRDGRVTLEGLRSALQDKLPAELLDDERITIAIKDLDVNNDGEIDRNEWIGIQKFRGRLEKQVKSQTTHPAVLRQRYVDSRIENFESHANVTDTPARIFAAACYMLPAVEIAAYGVLNVPLIAPALVDFSYQYHNVPMATIIALFALFNVALNYEVPRHVRFAARHACILDLLGVFFVPPGLHLPDPVGVNVPTAFEFLVFTCAVYALYGVSATFVPLTGPVTDKLTKDSDLQIIDSIQKAAINTFQREQLAPSSSEIAGDGPAKKIEKKKGFFAKIRDDFYREAGIDNPDDEKDP